MVVLSSMWERIQSDLFPFLEEELGELTIKQQQLVSVLEVIRIEDAVFSEYRTGRHKSDRKAIARAFVAKAVYNLSMTRELLDRLKCDKALRRICGWESLCAMPGESTFSRAFGEFAENRLPEVVHESTINNHMSDRLVGHISQSHTVKPPWWSRM